VVAEEVDSQLLLLLITKLIFRIIRGVVRLTKFIYRLRCKFKERIEQFVLELVEALLDFDGLIVSSERIGGG
jgi:hypothetical protein